MTELQIEVSPGEEDTVPVVSIRKPWRGHYTMENGVQISLSAPTVGETVSVVNGEAERMSELVESQRYLQVTVQVRNPTAVDHEPPALDWFELDTPTTSRAHRPLDRSAYEKPRSEVLYPNDAIHVTL